MCQNPAETCTAQSHPFRTKRDLRNMSAPLPDPADRPFDPPNATPPYLVEEAADDFELPMAGFKGTPEEIERQWFEKVYTGRATACASSRGGPS